MPQTFSLPTDLVEAFEMLKGYQADMAKGIAIDRPAWLVNPEDGTIQWDTFSIGSTHIEKLNDKFQADLWVFLVKKSREGVPFKYQSQSHVCSRGRCRQIKLGVVDGVSVSTCSLTNMIHLCRFDLCCHLDAARLGETCQLTSITYADSLGDFTVKNPNLKGSDEQGPAEARIPARASIAKWGAEVRTKHALGHGPAAKRKDERTFTVTREIEDIARLFKLNPRNRKHAEEIKFLLNRATNVMNFMHATHRDKIPHKKRLLQRNIHCYFHFVCAWSKENVRVEGNIVMKSRKLMRRLLHGHQIKDLAVGGKLLTQNLAIKHREKFFRLYRLAGDYQRCF